MPKRKPSDEYCVIYHINRPREPRPERHERMMRLAEIPGFLSEGNYFKKNTIEIVATAPELPRALKVRAR